MEQILAGLGLGNLVNSARASFNSIHFFENSATEGDTTKLNQLFDFLLKQRGIVFNYMSMSTKNNTDSLKLTNIEV